MDWSREKRIPVMRICLSIVSHGQADLVIALLESLNKFVVCEEHEVLIVITENKTSQIKHSCKYLTKNIQKGFVFFKPTMKQYRKK